MSKPDPETFDQNIIVETFCHGSNPQQYFVQERKNQIFKNEEMCPDELNFSVLDHFFYLFKNDGFERFLKLQYSSTT